MCGAVLERVTEHFQNMGIPVNQVMTDNGPCYRTRVFRNTCARFDPRPLHTRRDRPQTSGKAEHWRLKGIGWMRVLVDHALYKDSSIIDGCSAFLVVGYRDLLRAN